MIKRKLIAVITVSLLFLYVNSFAMYGIIKTQPTAGGVVLTFDDGPDNRNTQKILDILESYHIKATFFMVGEQANRFPDLVRAVHAAGHHIANHSYTHPMMTHLPSLLMQRQVTDTNAILVELTGVKPVCFRPPFGAHNKKIDSFIHSLGMQVVMWEVDSRDWKKIPPQKLEKIVLREAGAGEIILMHDGGGNRAHTIEALPDIIEALQKRGLTFETIC
jgi:peptidoglycan/xylan/chitin deacetylase (PgdA/CDA1 family)